MTKARKNLPWQLFETIFYQAVALAYELWPDHPDYLWNGLSVFAIDGSKYQLPASDELRQAFDPNSGLDGKLHKHYPQCMVSTVYDVFRRLPIARTIESMDKGERGEVKKMLPSIPDNGVIVFDRGYPSYDLMRHLSYNYKGFYLFRCKTNQTFPAVHQFIRSNKAHDIVSIKAPKRFLEGIPRAERSQYNPLVVRMIKLVSPDGTLSVLITNLMDEKCYLSEDIIQLYYRRWGVESYYRDEKVFLDILNFHTKKENGVRQELFAILIMSVIARIMMVLSKTSVNQNVIEPQFKHTVMSLAMEAFILTKWDPVKTIEIFQEIIIEIKRVKYYPPKSPRPSQPRVSKQPKNRWTLDKKKKLAGA